MPGSVQPFFFGSSASSLSMNCANTAQGSGRLKKYPNEPASEDSSASPLGYLLSRHIQHHARSTTPHRLRHKISGCSTRRQTEGSWAFHLFVPLALLEYTCTSGGAGPQVFCSRGRCAASRTTQGDSLLHPMLTSKIGEGCFLSVGGAQSGDSPTHSTSLRTRPHGKPDHCHQRRCGTGK